MKALRTDFKQLFDEHADEFLGYLDGLLRIPSVNGHPTFEAPFGIGPKRALEYTLKLANDLGFRTGSADNSVGWAEAGPTDDPEFFGVLGHLDVVDVTNDWNYPPFQLTKVDNLLYGRGVLDNKGPFLATLFALYLIKQQKITLKHRVRIMFGTDEESGSRDVKKYLKSEPAPSAGFTPDCKFPIVYGERGLIDLTLTKPISDGSLRQLQAITGEFDRSYIPDTAEVVMQDGSTQSFTGKKAPSNAPDMADNVIFKLATALKSLDGQTGDFFQWVVAKFVDQTAGEGLGLDWSDEASGRLQLSLYRIQMQDNQLMIGISMRYPISITPEAILMQLETQLLPKMTVTTNRSMASTLSNPNQQFIKSFSRIYATDTALDGTPVTTTGATYARAMPNIVAFGPSFPGQKGIAHKGDEWLKFSDWQMMMEIYYDCFLAQLR